MFDAIELFNRSFKTVKHNLIEEAKEKAADVIQNLNKEKLCAAFEAGKKQYISGIDQGSIGKGFLRQTGEPWVLFKNMMTFGGSAFFRFAKSTSRLPNKAQMTDENAKQILKDFLDNPHTGNNEFSLKFCVCYALMGFGFLRKPYAFTREGTYYFDIPASKIVNIIREQLDQSLAAENMSRPAAPSVRG